ncbi:protein arginine N-methyltransferase 6 [Trichogramma pretiosum]|uniref:protein arginine N-methyltransferase 6 n=1 Tax=Trichogramma pretiosum TaxID=7493 RepID=UPI0006C9A825|nr:protein arginine N-methyltransferase 6 [Trichogramma pretiosum]
MSDENNSEEYYKSYENLDVHHLMLSDKPRTLAYRTAILNAKDKFVDKVVMDVGAGTGILSMFCAQAGAKKVYAVEASIIAELIPDVAKENNFENKIEVIQKRVEDIAADEIEKVDIIVSEWMGFYLLHEGMLDSVIIARDRFLKQDGLIFPDTAKIYAAPCQLPSVHEFWDDVCGVKMRSVASQYIKAKIKPDVLDLPREDLLGDGVLLVWLDLNTIDSEDLNSLGIEESIAICNKAGNYQGFCIWFDVDFPDGSTLSTSPFSESTHWKQTIIVMPGTIKVEEKEPVAFNLKFDRNSEDCRKYNLSFTQLDPEEVSHPIPCDCYMTKCIVTKAFLESQEQE